MKNALTVFLALFLVLSICTPFAILAENSIITGSYNFELHTERITQESIDASREGAAVATLADDNSAYNLIKASMLQGETSIVLTEANCSDYSSYNTLATLPKISNIAMSMTSDNPEIFYYHNAANIGYSKYPDDPTLLQIKVNLYLLEEHPNLEADKATFNAAVDKILDEVIFPGMTDLEMELAIHDYIVLNCAYDTTYGADDTYNAYGVIVRKTAVCDGYARSFKLFMNRLGIPCQYVTGLGVNSSGSSEAHAWNRIQIGGEWYQVDTTWADPTPDKPGKVSYQYFNVDDATFKNPAISGMGKHINYDESTNCTSKSFENYRYINSFSGAKFTNNTVMYSSSVVSNPGLFSMDIDGSNNRTIHSGALYSMTDYKGLYTCFADYIAGVSITIYQIKRDGSEKKTLASATSSEFTITDSTLNYTYGSTQTLTLDDVVNRALNWISSDALITDCELTNNGSRATASLMVTATALNKSVKANLYLAIYDTNGAMIGISVIPANVRINSAKTFSISIDAPSGKTAASAKLFMMDSNMQPYIAAMTK